MVATTTEFGEWKRIGGRASTARQAEPSPQNDRGTANSVDTRERPGHSTAGGGTGQRLRPGETGN